MFNSNKFLQVISGFLAFGFTILQGIDWLFQKYSIDSKWFNYIIIGLFLAFIASLFYLFIKSRQSESQKPKSNDKKSKYIKVANVDRDFPDYGHMHWNEIYPAAAGHIWDIGTHNRTDAVAIFKKMRESNWISPHRTRYVRLRFNVYNGNTNLFAVVEDERQIKRISGERQRIKREI